MDSRDIYFMNLASTTALRSKDPNTKVGACIAKHKKVLSLGYNGAPRYIKDSLVPLDCRDKTKPLREQKYPYIVHSELNAILNYSGQLEDLKDSTVYVTTFPCCDCAKTLIQVGVKKIVYQNDYSDTEVCEMAKYLFDLAGVKYEQLEVNE